MSSRQTGSRLRAGAGAAAAAVLVTGLTGMPAQPAAARADTGTPGSAGIGDPYFPDDGNGGYDALHYAASIDVAGSGARISGHSVMRARATQPLSSFDLDLSGLTVTSVKVNGSRAHWSRQGDHELVITPSAALPDKQVFTTEIGYHGKPGIVTTPDGYENGWFTSSDGATAVGQPPSVQVWMPVNEHPADKATFDLRLNVGAKRAAISNGRLVRRIPQAHGRSTWVWHSAEPMASYLVLLSVGKYHVTTRTTASGVHLLDALDPAVRSVAGPAVAAEPEVLRVLSRSFGRYPFTQAGSAVDDLDVGYALETQTRPFYTGQFFTGSAEDDTWVIAHELAHQWYGDSVSLRQWRDIWLNEGFATYAQWLWAAHQGSATPASITAGLMAEIPADDGFWDVDISDPGAVDLFSDPVYVRGAMVLQALRAEVGSPTFFTILKSWAKEHRNGHGTTAQFISLAERSSGQDLGDLFDTWLFGTGKPVTSAASARVVTSRHARRVAELVLDQADRLAGGDRARLGGS